MPFKEETVLMSLSCTSNPSPAKDGHPYSKRSFHESPLDAIIYFRFHVQSFHTMPLEEAITFSLFLHRRSLLKLIQARPRHSTHPVKWDTWGPSVSRLLDSRVISQWTTTTSGERYVSLNHGGTEIIVLDFNPERIKALQEQTVREDEQFAVTDESSFIHGSLTSPVQSKLPYAYYKRKDLGPFNSILIDGERLLGLRRVRPPICFLLICVLTTL